MNSLKQQLRLHEVCATLACSSTGRAQVSNKESMRRSQSRQMHVICNVFCAACSHELIETAIAFARSVRHAGVFVYRKGEQRLARHRAMSPMVYYLQYKKLFE